MKAIVDILLILFGVIDLLGAIWTGLSLRSLGPA